MTIQRLRFFLCFTFLCTSLLLHSQATADKKHGRNVVHNKDGSVSVGRSKNYLREGKWYESYRDHTKKNFGKYHLGLAEGRHIMYWPNGKVSSIRDFTRGKHNGKWIEFSESGDTIEHLNFNMDVLQGYFLTYDSVNDVRTSGTYVNGKKSGWCVVKGHIVTDSCEYREGMRHGKQITRAGESIYHTVGYFKNDEKDSVFRTYEYGKLEREYWYFMGKPYKSSIVYYSGTDSVIFETRYKSPDMVSMYIKYYPNGAYQKVEWYSNQHLDSITEYYFNGKIQCRYIYRAQEFGLRQLVRQYIGYDSTGRTMYFHYCDTDGLDSIHRYYGAAGSLLRELEYVNGSMYGEKYFYPNGAPMVFISSENIVVYSETGKQLRPATPAYNKTFSRIDSLESPWPDQLLFPPIIWAQPMDPKLPDPDFHYPVDLPDRMPEFVGGPDSLKGFMSRNLKYPTQQRDNGEEANVRIRFIVEKDGSFNNVEAILDVNGVSTPFTREALRVVKLMPKWTPGSVNGVRVRTLMTLPVVFRLD